VPELVFFRRGEEVLRFALDRRRVVLGRGERSDVVLPDPELFESQAAIVIDGKTAHLQDLSGQGTLVGGVKTSAIALVDGADIALGQWRALYRDRAAGDRPDATEARATVNSVVPESDSGRVLAAQLRVRQGGQESVHRFSGDVLTVGKDPENDVVLEDRFLSARHLRLTRKGQRFHVLDQGSTNGTFLGAVRVFDVEVPAGTALKAGGCELVLEPLATARRDTAFEGLLGNDASMRQLAELLERVAPSSAAVAILGESGTGKELVAHAIHAKSARRDKPFIPVNCAAISKELIESELFGHEKGAFTGALNARRGAFEEADGGTLFLDEIGELPLDLQAKLLRALESGEIKRVGAARPITVDVRIVAATNRDLLTEAKKGRFREDLYYRLCVVPVHLSPLRSRAGDIGLLAQHFLDRFTPRGQTVRLTPAAIERLCAHRWPGNVRELRNVVHRALLLRKGPMLEPSDLTFDQDLSGDNGGVVAEAVPGQTLEQIMERLERQVVESALRRCNNNRERVARELGVARSTLFKRLKEWGLTKADETE
jgi:DNA-binding NtrC family response regulator/pSer/pThr/pTyr-binding forkhead associated (FHA) protein